MFYALHAVVRPCIICLLVVLRTQPCAMPHYQNVSAVVNLRVVRKRCQTSCTSDYNHTAVLLWHGVVQSLKHCYTVHSPLHWWIFTHYTINLSVQALGVFITEGGRSLLEVPCAFVELCPSVSVVSVVSVSVCQCVRVSFSLSVCDRLVTHRRIEVQFFSERNRLSLISG